MPRKKRTIQEINKPVSLKERVWNAALYVRLSREDSDKDESLSVQNQREILTNYIEEHEDLNLSGIYIDDGFTGTDFERPNFQRMMQDAEQKKIDCVIVKDLSRLGRNSTLVGNYLDNVFPNLNIRLIAVYDYLDTYRLPASSSGLMVSFKNIINEDYCRQASEKIRAVLDMKRKKGEFVGSFAAYGYQKSPADYHKLVIDEEAAQVVRDIFTWYISGMSKGKIAAKLNSLGIPNPATYKKQKGLRYEMPHGKITPYWSESTVQRILKNEIYTGNMVQGKLRVKSFKNHKQEVVPKESWYVVEGTHEAIVSRELFDKAAELTSRDLRISPKNTEVYLFAGFLRCGDCGHSMHRKKSKEYVYYLCRSFKEYGVCTRHSIRHEALEQAVFEAVRLQIALAVSYENILPTLQKAPVIKRQAGKIQSSISANQAELDKITRFKRSLYEDWKNGDITREEYRSMKAEYEAEEGRLQRVLANLEVERQKLGEDIEGTNPVIEAFTKYQNITELTRDILIELVDRVLVYEGQRIEIHFKFADVFENIERNIKDCQSTAAQTA